MMLSEVGSGNQLPPELTGGLNEILAGGDPSTNPRCNPKR
jgi:hypothetical protein